MVRSLQAHDSAQDIKSSKYESKLSDILEQQLYYKVDTIQKQFLPNKRVGEKNCIPHIQYLN
jgi:hypothetical protein